MSNERTLTRWGNVSEGGRVRLKPNPRARVVTRLHKFTEDGFPEVYIVLRRWKHLGKTWLLVRLPMRPNGRRGWVREQALTQLYEVRTRLVVDRRHLRASLYRGGRLVWRAPIGIGAPSTPTPGGRFWIRERIRVPFGGSLYGPWAFGTSAYSNLTDWPGGGVVGMHGTNEPSLVPGRPSHGCIRVRNGDIRSLAKLLPVGTPLRIL